MGRSVWAELGKNPLLDQGQTRFESTLPDSKVDKIGLNYPYDK